MIMETQLLWIMALPLLANSMMSRSPSVSCTSTSWSSSRRSTAMIPVARGRELFGGIVDWARIWNPGADSATTITFTRDITVEGTELAAGSYTMWMIPQESGPWPVIFSNKINIYHTPYPGEEYDRIAGNRMLVRRSRALIPRHSAGEWSKTRRPGAGIHQYSSWPASRKSSPRSEGEFR